MISESYISHRIVECLSSSLAIARKEGFGIISHSLETAIDNMTAPMQLAIIGKVSSSKSTLVNAILGKADVVGTGQMEETYNVSWLKYGPSDSDIVVKFKDGSSKYVPRNEWKNWAGQESNVLKDKVRYLEVTYDHEILKGINIIDTPGLDSAKGSDSRNTIEFLKEVRPDAVIMVFTKGLAQSTLDVVKDFQGSQRDAFNLTPLNAIGLLSKTDFLWKIDQSEILPNEKAHKDVIEGNIYTLFPEIKDSLYTILPICSMLGLASSTVTNEDVNLLQGLAKIDEADLKEMLYSVNDFTDDFFKTQISLEQRKYLQQKFGLYGIYEAIRLSQKGLLTVELLKKHYRNISGYMTFEKCLYSHFGHRSFLIKTQSIYGQISSACDTEREKWISPSAIELIDSIQESVLSCLMGIFEYKQLDFLSKIYANKMNITDKVAVEEYKRICGEYGTSVVDKLNLSGKPAFHQMETISQTRCNEWNAKYQLAYFKSKDNAELYRMLSTSYDMLSKDIKSLSEKEREARNILKLVEDFFYGK